MKLNDKLLLLLFLIIAGCSEQEKTSASKFSGAIEESERIMDSLLQTGRTPGIDIAISIHREVVWSEAFGFADLEHEVPVIPGVTRFRIGSVSKPVTAAAMGRLMDLGKMNVNEVVQTYVPYFPEKKYPITIAEVAGHISGIRHYQDEEFLMSKHFGTVKEGLAIFSKDSLLFEPGEHFSYSSYGFNLLSAAIEGATGEDFLDIMEREVFGPLGMTSTCADLNDSIILHRASFYELNNEGFFGNARYVDNSYKWAGGGFISTTLDLLKFGEAHMHPGYLSETTLNKLTSPQRLNNGESTNYGMGWFLGFTAARKRISHGGGSIGGITDFIVLPEEELVLAVLSNSSDTHYGDITERIIRLFLEAEHSK